MVEVLVGDELSAHRARPVSDDGRAGVGEHPHRLGEGEQGAYDIALLRALGQGVRRGLHGHAGQEHEGLRHQESAVLVLEQVKDTASDRLAEHQVDKPLIDCGSGCTGNGQGVEDHGTGTQSALHGNTLQLAPGVAGRQLGPEDLIRREEGHSQIDRCRFLVGGGDQQPAGALVPARDERRRGRSLQHRITGRRVSQIAGPQRGGLGLGEHLPHGLDLLGKAVSGIHRRSHRACTAGRGLGCWHPDYQ